LKLLFDQNLSPGLVECLADIYPDSTHVWRIGLDRASDHNVWITARDQGYIITSKDADYSDLSDLLGFPPKVIWIRRGNCSTREIEAILRVHYHAVEDLHNDPNSGVLALF